MDNTTDQAFTLLLVALEKGQDIAGVVRDNPNLQDEMIKILEIALGGNNDR